MSYDSSSQLRDYLQRIDLSAPAIQGAAGAMMKHYDKSPGVAVVEWRNALHHARVEQYLPLLYVANEVLQNSKRNRGNKFLEAFSPVLGQSLVYICDRSTPELVENIRRTVKIWADRRVFSIRYVNDLIMGLEPYRNGGKNNKKKKAMSSNDGNSSPGGSRFSPVSQPEETNPTASKSSTSSSSLVSPSQNKKDNLEVSTNDNDDEDNGDDLFGDDNNSFSQDTDDVVDDDDDDNDLFGNASKKLLKIDIDFDSASNNATETAASGNSKKKRRRSSNEEDGLAAAIAGKSRRRSLTLLSTNSLMELWNQVSALQSSYDRVSGKIKEMNSGDDNNTTTTDSGGGGGIDALVGDELLAEYKKVLGYEQQIDKHRRELHSIAQKRRSLEIEAVRYLPWLERALKQDQEDIDFSDKHRTQLDIYSHVYVPAKLARDQRLREEKHRQMEEEKLRRKKEEEEEQEKFKRSAMKKQTEAQPGMVWNRATGEYQHLNQNEDWRD
jgi:hypothetical protein